MGSALRSCYPAIKEVINFSLNESLNIKLSFTSEFFKNFLLRFQADIMLTEMLRVAIFFLTFSFQEGFLYIYISIKLSVIFCNISKFFLSTFQQYSTLQANLK